MVSYPKEAEFVRDARESLDSGDIPDAFAGMVSAYLSKMTVDQEALSGVLYLNANNPFIQALANMESAEKREPVLDLVYQMARLLAGRLLDAEKITAMFQNTNAALTRLIQ